MENIIKVSQKIAEVLKEKDYTFFIENNKFIKIKHDGKEVLTLSIEKGKKHLAHANLDYITEQQLTEIILFVNQAYNTINYCDLRNTKKEKTDVIKKNALKAKNSLFTGDIVVLETEEECIVLKGCRVGDCIVSYDGLCIPLSDYNDDLENSVNARYDVKQILKPIDEEALLSDRLDDYQKVMERAEDPRIALLMAELEKLKQQQKGWH